VDPRVVVDKNDVIVEQENVEDEHAELDEEGQKKSDEPRRLRLLVVVVKLEQITVQVLIGHVNDTDDEEVKARGDSVPRDELADRDGEAADPFLGQVVDKDEENEEDRVGERTHHHYSQLLVHLPVRVVHLYFVPFEAEVGYWGVDQL